MGTKINDLTMDCGNDYRGEFQQDYENYMRDYINPMYKQIKHRDNILKVKNYPFLEPIKKIQTKIIMFLMIIGMTLGGMSCKKDFNDREYNKPAVRELVNVDFKLTNVIKVSMDGIKGFDPTTWVYEFNPGTFDLVFDNATYPDETIVIPTTIEALRAGISVSLMEGNYWISFNSQHTGIETADIDISIAMNNIPITKTTTTIELVGNYDDYLLIADVYNQTAGYIWDISRGVGNEIIETLRPHEDFLFGYYNQCENPNLFLRIETNGSPHVIPLEGKQTGNVYWFSSGIPTGVEILFPEWLVNKIII